MKTITIVGIVLVIVGVIAIFFQGIPVSAEKDTVKLGPIEATVREEKRLPVPLGLSIAAIAGGLVLVVLGNRK
jgi:hypothetical protein